MKRLITQKLQEWRQSPRRKPLILQGMRQVGKTYILKDFGDCYFPQTHYFNFEKDNALSKAFQGDLDPKQLLLSLSFHQNKDIRIETDLIIFDEIQACPRALTSLKYFCEELPNATICAAGSLLGIHLNTASYPVGKVDMLKLYPMNFQEFLLALGQEKLYQFLINYTLTDPINELIHARLWEYLKYYFVVGGLPEVVSIFADLQSQLFNAFENVRLKQSELIVAYQADIAKHAGKVNAMHIDRIWRAIPQQLAREQNGGAAKFKFKGIIPNVDRYDRMADAIDWLCAAQLVIKQPIAQKANLPLSAYIKENTFKLYLSDVGLLGALSDLSPKTLLDYDYGSYKGYFAENFVAQAFLATGVNQLYSWQEGGSEIEFLREVNGNLIPIEVKSGWVTRAKSLQSFATKYHPLYSIILSASNHISKSNAKNRYYPLYLASSHQIFW
jgi:uncharacterized protein